MAFGCKSFYSLLGVSTGVLKKPVVEEEEEFEAFYSLLGVSGYLTYLDFNRYLPNGHTFYSLLGVSTLKKLKVDSEVIEFTFYSLLGVS